MMGLDKRRLKSFVRRALHEDVKDGDHTTLSCIPSDQISRGKLLFKDEGVIAGIEIAEYIFSNLDPHAIIDKKLDDGDYATYGTVAFYLTCNTHAFLMGERLALNTMQRLSGIATLSRAFQKEVKGIDVTILDTRKTTPLLRFLEKWAVRIGGCTNYREGLYDRVMIKDNHIEAAGSISNAIHRAEEYLKRNNLSLDMTVEVKNLTELKEVLQLKSHPRVMLDNFDIPTLKRAVSIVKGKLETEASGGIKLNNVRAVAETGVDFISVGALTHSAQSLDISLKIID